MMSEEANANSPPSVMDNNPSIDNDSIDTDSMDNSLMDNSSMYNDSTDNASTDTTEESAINRITNLPIVTSALTSVSNAYQWTKESSSIIGYSLDMAEKTVAMAAHTAQPVIDYLDRPISAANSVANQQLDKLEEKVPIITEPSDKVVESLKESAWGAVEQGKATGTQKMNELMDTRLGKVVTSTVDAALGLSDMAVDYCLPEEKTNKLALEGGGGNDDVDNSSDDEEDEQQLQGDESSASNREPFSNSVHKASQVSIKVRQRLYHKALVNIQYAQKRSQETLQKLHFTVDLIAYARENIDSANSGIRLKVDSTQENLWNTWNDWTTEHSEEGEGDENKDEEDVEARSGEQKTLAIARNLTRRMRVLSNNLTASIRVLPQSIRKRVEDTRGSIELIFDTFEEAQYFKDLPSSILTSAKERLEILSTTSLALADYLVNSSAMQWLVPYPLRQIVNDSLSSTEKKLKEKKL